MFPYIRAGIELILDDLLAEREWKAKEKMFKKRRINAKSLDNLNVQGYNLTKLIHCPGYTYPNS